MYKGVQITIPARVRVRDGRLAYVTKKTRHDISRIRIDTKKKKKKKTISIVES